MFYYISFESFRLILGFICFFHHSIWLLCMGITRNAQSNDRETAKIYTTARAKPEQTHTTTSFVLDLLCLMQNNIQSQYFFCSLCMPLICDRIEFVYLVPVIFNYESRERLICIDDQFEFQFKSNRINRFEIECIGNHCSPFTP